QDIVVLEVAEASSQGLHMNGDIIDDHEALRPEKEAGRVARTRIHFQYALTEVALESTQHPAPESRSPAQTLAGNHRVVVSGTGVQETELEDQPERLHPIPPPDVLAFCVGATVVADRNLIDASTPLSEASSHLRLDAEAIAGQPQTLEYVSANRLVTRFHVREIEVVR